MVINLMSESRCIAKEAYGYMKQIIQKYPGIYDRPVDMKEIALDYACGGPWQSYYNHVSMIGTSVLTDEHREKFLQFLKDCTKDPRKYIGARKMSVYYRRNKIRRPFQNNEQ